MKNFILLLICIIVKLIYLNKIIRYDFFFPLYSILSVEIKNIIRTLIIKPGLTWRVDPGPDTPTAWTGPGLRKK
jgi:hypothetical protein